MEDNIPNSARKIVRLRRRNIPEDELLADIRRVAVSLSKQSISSREYNRAGRFNSGNIAARFGSWPDALLAAGLTPDRPEIETDESFFENLLDIWTKLGRQPAFRDMRRPLSKWSGQQYDRRFESWNNALVAFAQHVDAALGDQDVPTDTASIRPNSANRRTPRAPNLRLRWQVLKRDSFRCKCGRSPATDASVELHVDHVVSWSSGGETVLEAANSPKFTR